MEYKIYILKTIEDESPRYVGITTGKLNTRLTKHMHDINRKSCKNLHKKNWLSKYKELIVIEQIDSANSIDEMKSKEIFYIKKYRREGFELLNLTDGGDGTYGYKHSEDSIEKIRSSSIGRKHTQEWIENAKNRIPHNKGIKTGKPSWNRGISCTDVVKNKIRNKKTGTKDSDETRMRKSKSSKSYLRKKIVECLIDGNWIMFASATDAAKILNIERSKISLVCSGKRNHVGGYKFRYKV